MAMVEKYTCIKRANGRVYYEKKNVPGGKKSYAAF